MSLRRGREGTLGTFAGSTETTKGTLVLRHVLLESALEVLEEIINHAVIEIFSAQVSVSSSGFDFENTFLNRQKRHVEGTTTKIKDKNRLFFSFLVQTVGNGGGGGLVDDTENVESGNGSSVLGGLSLRIVEISWDCDDRVLDFLGKVGFSNLLHLGEDHGRDLLRLELLLLALVLDFDHRGAASARYYLERPVLHVRLHTRVGKLAANKALGIKDGVRRVHGGLRLGGISDQTLRLGKGNVRRGGTVSLVVSDDLHAVVLPDTDARVSRSEVDSDAFSSNSCTVIGKRYFGEKMFEARNAGPHSPLHADLLLMITSVWSCFV
jgi:hypothetical protein